MRQVARVYWKENKVISIKLRNGKYMLAQMLPHNYMLFFSIYSEDNIWPNYDLSEADVLFCHYVTRYFLKQSLVSTVVNVVPIKNYNIPTLWLHTYGFSDVLIWEGEPFEKKITTTGGTVSLIQKDIEHPQNNLHKSGICVRMVIDKLRDEDYETIVNYEFDSMGIFPILNERLYLCEFYHKNIDPKREVLFHQKIPCEYKVFMDILAGEARFTTWEEYENYL